MEPILFLLLEDSESSSSLGETIIEKLVPNLGSFLTQFFALVVFVVIVLIFGYKPIRKMIKKRQDYVESNINEAAESNKAAKLALSQSNERVIASEKEAHEIIEQAKIDAKAEKQKILDETSVEVEQMKVNAKKEIDQMVIDEQENMHKEMVDIALTASSELLKRNISSEDNEKLVDDFIKEMDS